MDIERLKERIRDVADFPKPGIVFKDITPLLADELAFSTVIDLIVVHYGRGSVDKVVGIEARGFILASPVAYHFGAGFVPVRKEGKLPYDTETEEYELEYGTAALQIHKD
ncbi:MAG: adenine phosphoribosyltransferase, partial [Actinobacteria bacterium]|nr:adenine phosphoribosyltransferase [Actinomycetota bacterium]